MFVLDDDGDAVITATPPLPGRGKSHKQGSHPQSQARTRRSTASLAGQAEGSRETLL